VYTLSDPRIEDPIKSIRYVGLSLNPFDRIYDIKQYHKDKDTPFGAWLRELKAAKLSPIVTERPNFESEQQAFEFYGNFGAHLLNSRSCLSSDGIASDRSFLIALGLRINSALMQAQIPLEQLAGCIPCKLAVLQQYLAGKRAMPLLAVRRVSAVLGVSPAWLTFGEAK